MCLLHNELELYMDYIMANIYDIIAGDDACV